MLCRDWFRLVLGVSLWSSCASDVHVEPEVAVRASPLELECAAAAADVTSDVFSILSSTDPLDPSRPQAYGSEHCTGFVFEFENPDEEEWRGAWIQASGESSASSDVLGESRCPGRTLEADYWGFQKREWTKLASTSGSGVFEPGATATTGHCRLDGLIEHAGTYEKLRIVARVAQGAETYPMYACVW
jgi:hypothetical protein